MARRRRLLEMVPSFAMADDLERLAHRLAARYPGAEYDDQEATDFFVLAQCLDRVSRSHLLKILRASRFHIPPRLQTDVYRIGRYLVSRWQAPGMRQHLLRSLVGIDPKVMAPLRNADAATVWETLGKDGPIAALWALWESGMGDRIPEVLALFTPEEEAIYRGALQVARLLLHKFITDPDLLERQIPRREQRRIIQQIRRRDLQMSALRRSIYSLSRERKALVARTRQAERAARSALDALSSQLERIRQEAADAEQAHATALAEQARRHAEEIGALQSQIQAAHAQFAAALAERRGRAPAASLSGKVVAVVGDEGRRAGYQALVESAGARMVHLNAVEKLNRIPEAVTGADVVILVTAHAKHSAERLLRKAVSPAALVLRCPKAGLAALQRTLQEEALPRLAARQVSAGAEGR